MNVGIDARPLADRFPGIGRYLAGLIPAIAEADPELRLTVFADPRAREGRFNPFSFAGSRVEVVELDAGIFSPLAQLRAARAIDRRRLDLLHAPYFLTPVGLRTPLVLTVHDLIPLSHPEVLPGRLARLIYPFLIATACRTARRVIAVSEWVARDLAERDLAESNRVQVIPEAADELPAPTLDPAPGNWPDAPYLLFVGSDKPLKNLPFLVRAYAASGVAAPLVLAGPLDERHRDTRITIEALGLHDRVLQLGPVDEARMGDLYRGALAFLFPSRAEGFGLPPLEAMTYGVPVVCSTAASLPEVTGNTALLLSPDDERGWSRAIKQIAEDGALRATLAAAGRQRAKQFSWQRAAEATVEVYRTAIGRPTTAAAR